MTAATPVLDWVMLSRLQRAWTQAWAAAPSAALADSFEDALATDQEPTDGEVGLAQWTALVEHGLIVPEDFLGAYVVPDPRADHAWADCFDADCNLCD
jgi:hypothetical protein